MKRIYRVTIAALIGIILLGAAVSTYGLDNSGEDHILGDVNTLTADFILEVKVLSASGHEYGTQIPDINRICVFKVNRYGNEESTGQAGVYDISFFLDNRFAGMYKSQELPFSLKRNFRGMKDGMHVITFVTRDEEGRIGKGGVEIRVKH